MKKKKQASLRPVEKRTIEELVALYECEPEIRDIFVEGAADRAVVDWYLRRRMDRRVTVLEINDIDIPAAVVCARLFDDGNRGRALTLAYELDERLSPAAMGRVTIVFDSDWDALLGITHVPSVLVPTDYSCLEMYLFNETVLDKFLCVVVLGASCSTRKLMAELGRVLQRLFVIRITNHVLKWGMKWVTCERTCTKNDGAISFDEAEFVKRYLAKNGRLAARAIFEAEMHRIQRCMGDDARHQINGHDFVEMLTWYLRSLVGDKRSLKECHTVGRALFACLELEQLDAQPMFQRLLQRVVI